MDLGTCFFALDDSPEAEALGRYADLEAACAGAPPDPARPLQRAYASLFARLAATTDYRALRREFVAALRVRHAMRTGQTRLDSAGYLALREITIYFGPWLSTWELLVCRPLSPAERAAVAPVFVPANRWQVLENERVSVCRDTRTGTPNVIALVAAERGVSLSTAAAFVADRADAELAAYTRALRALRVKRLAPSVATYLDLVEHGVDGARRHHEGGADPARYRGNG